MKLSILVAAALIVAGPSIAAEKSKKGDKHPISQGAIVTPQGGISFGESAAQTPAQQHRARIKWDGMTQKEIDGLTVLLKGATNKSQVNIVCQDPLCEDLALNLDNAFESAKWKSDLLIGTQFGIPAGISASSQWLVDAFNGATGDRYHAKLDDPKSADGEYLLIGAKPR